MATREVVHDRVQVVPTSVLEVKVGKVGLLHLVDANGEIVDFSVA